MCVAGRLKLRRYMLKTQAYVTLPKVRRLPVSLLTFGISQVRAVSNSAEPGFGLDKSKTLQECLGNRPFYFVPEPLIIPLIN